MSCRTTYHPGIDLARGIADSQSEANDAAFPPESTNSSNSCFVGGRGDEGSRMAWEFGTQRSRQAARNKALVRAGISNFQLHVLRHTWESWYVQAGTPLHIARSGRRAVNRDGATFAHLAPEHFSEQASRILTGLEPVRTFSRTSETTKATEVALIFVCSARHAGLDPATT